MNQPNTRVLVQVGGCGGRVMQYLCTMCIDLGDASGLFQQNQFEVLPLIQHDTAERQAGKESQSTNHSTNSSRVGWRSTYNVASSFQTGSRAFLIGAVAIKLFPTAIRQYGRFKRFFSTLTHKEQTQCNTNYTTINSTSESHSLSLSHNLSLSLHT
jgi:hypothetical protein